MAHVNKETAAGAVEMTLDTLDQIASAGRDEFATLRNVVLAMSTHALMMGQFDLSKKVNAVLIGERPRTNPVDGGFNASS